MAKTAQTIYRKLYRPNHPLADMLGFVKLHKLIAVAARGHALETGEVVHHKDFDKGNNLSVNLQIMTRKQHQRLPELQARFLIEKQLLNEFFVWWEEHKDDGPTETAKLHQQLISAENEKEMINRKLQKHEAIHESTDDNKLIEEYLR